MNAQAQPIRDVEFPEVSLTPTASPPRLANAPLRNTAPGNVIHLLGDHVVVAREYHDDTEAQLRHLTAAVVDLERANNTLAGQLTLAEESAGFAQREREEVRAELAEAKRTIATLTEAKRRADEAFAESLPLYQANVIVAPEGAPTGIDWTASMIASFDKLALHWKVSTRALAELVEVRLIEKTVGATAEYQEREPRAWQAARDVLDGYVGEETAESIATLKTRLGESEANRLALRDEVERLTRELNTPETADFLAAVMREAAHQRERWGTEHDGNKGPEDWFWLLGYLSGKALRGFAQAAFAEDTAKRFDPPSETFGAEAKAFREKAIHHLITSAAALANWHLNATGANDRMRAGKPFPFQADEEPESALITAPSPDLITPWP
jgi:hypothetical protein